MTRIQGLIASTAVVVASSAGAQSWIELDVPGPERCGVNLAFDELRGEVVLRCTSTLDKGDQSTFTWDGERWTDHGGGVAINQTDLMVYDSARERVTMRTGNRGFFVWAGTTWNRVELGDEPAVRNAAMAYDANRDLILLWGNGDEAPGIDSELWAWDGATWELISVGQPSISAGAQMAYDPVRDQLVLVGGQNLAVTWYWDGGSWTRTEDRSLALRDGHAMAYDSVNQQIVVFGGRQDGVVLSDTWTWDGTGWRLRSMHGPDPRYDHGLAFDSIREEAVLFGGYDGELPCFDDTWIWRNCQADLDGDNDADADDFFLYLDLFASGDDEADLDEDGDLDADDYQIYLDRFATIC